ncbi:MAG TPA: hypothetical protein VGU20_05435 [Stellaceae bacterium]|nr:hypothetical protein [Stellaceae bacterium]
MPSFRPLAQPLPPRSADRQALAILEAAREPPFDKTHFVIRNVNREGRAALLQSPSLPAAALAGAVGRSARNSNTAAFLRAFLILVIGVSAGYLGSYLRPAPAHLASPPAAAPDATALATGPSFPVRLQATSGDERVGQAGIVALRRGDESLRIGDIVTARRFYEFAASAGIPEAATAVAQTYDPAYLKTAGVRGVTANAEIARDWYAKAASQGDARAAQRLQSLERN